MRLIHLIVRDKFANLNHSCFGLNMLTTLPLEAFVCRSVMTTYYFPDEPFNPNRHLIFTTSLVVTSMALALITCDLGMVFELIGATSAAALAYIFPPLCYIKLSSASRREKIPAYVCVGFGLVVMGVSVVQAVANAITSKYLTSRRVFVLSFYFSGFVLLPYTIFSSHLFFTP